jgi:hypothetical protein
LATVTVFAPAVALLVMVKVATIWVVPLTVMALMVIPVFGEMATEVDGVKLVPVRITATLVPREPEFGEILDKVGGVPAATSIAPALTLALFVLRGLPKKSSLGAAA